MKGDVLKNADAAPLMKEYGDQGMSSSKKYKKTIKVLHMNCACTWKSSDVIKYQNNNIFVEFTENLKALKSRGSRKIKYSEKGEA